jgi:hypothetical protein
MPRPIRTPHLFLTLMLSALCGCDLLGGLFPGGGGGGGSEFPKRNAWSTFNIATATTNVRPSAVQVADFDGDGRLDVVVAYEGNPPARQPSVVIFFQNFAGANITWVGVIIGQRADLTGVSALAVADINIDGRLDVIAAANERILYMRGPEDPRIAAGWQMFTITGSQGADLGPWTDVAVGQIDNLRGPDIVASSSGPPGRISFFAAPETPNNGLGWVRFDIANANRAGAAAIALHDISRDGRLDVVSSAPEEANQQVVWHRNPGGNAMLAWTRFVIGSLRSATRLAIGDLNADGRVDVVATNPAALSAAGANDGIQIAWFRQPDDAATAWDGFILAQFLSNTPFDIRVTDVDVNGTRDVAAGTRVNGTLRWFSRRNDVTQTWIENNIFDLPSGINVQRIALGDIDADARLDVIATLRAADQNNDRVAWYLNPE